MPQYNTQNNNKTKGQKVNTPPLLQVSGESTAVSCTVAAGRSLQRVPVVHHSGGVTDKALPEGHVGEVQLPKQLVLEGAMLPHPHLQLRVGQVSEAGL